MLFFILFISIIIVTAILIMFSISWTVHVDMSIEQNKPYDWCTFRTFLKEFDKYKNNPELYIDKIFDNSIFLYEANCKHVVYLHASIIEFNEKCMILYPHSWMQYCIWQNRFVKSRNRQRGLWK